MGITVKTSRPKTESTFQYMCCGLPLTLLQERIMIVGVFFGTALVKPNSGQTTMGWSTSIRLVIGHLGSKVHIEDPD